MTSEIFTQAQFTDAIKAEFDDGTHNVRLSALLDYEKVGIDLLGDHRMVKLAGWIHGPEEISIIAQVENDDRFFKMTAHNHYEFGADWNNVEIREVIPKKVTTIEWITAD